MVFDVLFCRTAFKTHTDRWSKRICSKKGLVERANRKSAWCGDIGDQDEKFGKSSLSMRRNGFDTHAHVTKVRKQGSFAIQFAVFWGTLAFFLGVILWLRLESSRKLREQKKIDSCLVTVLENRCRRLNLLSTTNQKLIDLTHALAVLKLGQKAAIFIPGAQGAVVASKATEITIRSIAESVARYQDLQIELEKINQAGLFKCGIPTSSPTTTPKFTRKQTPESELTKSPAPLEWENSVQAGFLEVRSKDLEFKSHGSCEPERPASKKALRGEISYLTLRKPVALDRSPSKWLPFSSLAPSSLSFF